MKTQKISKYEIAYENEQEFRTIKKEVWTRGVYAGIKLDAKRPLILDIGAHIGIATLFFKAHYPTSSIFAVEPLEANYKLLMHNIEKNGLSENVKGVNAAVGSASGESDFYYHGEMNVESRWLSNAGFLPGSWKGTQISAKITVETVTLDYVIEEALRWGDCDKIDLLKMDVEGAESGILRSSEFNPGLVKNVVLEAHGNGKRIRAILTHKGYDVSSTKGEDGLEIVMGKK